jgi:hypothetical protein
MLYSEKLRLDRLKARETLNDFLKRNPEVTWRDVELGYAEKKEYGRWRRRFKKVNDAYLYADWAIDEYKRNTAGIKEREEFESAVALAEAGNYYDKLTTLADFLHDKNCGLNHVDACSYRYGNWSKPETINHTMSVEFLRAERLMETHGLKKLSEIIDLVNRGDAALKKLLEA